MPEAALLAHQEAEVFREQCRAEEWVTESTAAPPPQFSVEIEILQENFSPHPNYPSPFPTPVSLQGT